MLGLFTAVRFTLATRPEWLKPFLPLKRHERNRDGHTCHRRGLSPVRTIYLARYCERQPESNHGDANSFHFAFPSPSIRYLEPPAASFAIPARVFTKSRNCFFIFPSAFMISSHARQVSSE